jgi:hypothetical protein
MSDAMADGSPPIPYTRPGRLEESGIPAAARYRLTRHGAVNAPEGTVSVNPAALAVPPPVGTEAPPRASQVLFVVDSNSSAFGMQEKPGLSSAGLWENGRP